MVVTVVPVVDLVVVVQLVEILAWEQAPVREPEQEYKEIER